MSSVLCKRLLDLLFFEMISSLRRRLSGLWESGNPGLGFPLSHGPQFFLRLVFRFVDIVLVAGAVGMWESRGLGEIPKELWEEGEACFWLSTLSIAPPFPQLARRILQAGFTRSPWPACDPATEC